jgi:hypothetical protein
LRRGGDAVVEGEAEDGGFRGVDGGVGRSGGARGRRAREERRMYSWWTVRLERRYWWRRRMERRGFSQRRTARRRGGEERPRARERSRREAPREPSRSWGLEPLRVRIAG